MGEFDIRRVLCVLAKIHCNDYFRDFSWALGQSRAARASTVFAGNFPDTSQGPHGDSHRSPSSFHMISYNLEWFQMFREHPRWFQMSAGDSRWSLLISDGIGWSRIIAWEPRWAQMTPGDPRGSEMIPDALRWFQTISGVPRWPRMSLDDSRWAHTVHSDSRNFTTTQLISNDPRWSRMIPNETKWDQGLYFAKHKTRTHGSRAFMWGLINFHLFFCIFLCLLVTAVGQNHFKGIQIRVHCNQKVVKLGYCVFRKCSYFN